MIASSSSVTDDEQIDGHPGRFPGASTSCEVGLFDDPDGEGNYYDLEIENFAAPLVDNVDLPAKDQFDVLNDTGLSQFDNVTSRTTPEIILEADLDEFFFEGIDILTAAEAEAGLTPGAAVEVFVNGNSVGFAEPIAASGNTLFRYTFEPGELPVTDLDPEASFVADSGGWLHYVKGAVRIFDGQMDDARSRPDPATGRTQLSEPLELVVDTVAPAASLPNLLASSDSGRFNDDNVTNITTPAFDGTAEHNAIIRVFAIDVTDPGNPGPAELVGQGRVGTDLTEDGFNQVGSWEVTIEPLDDHSNDPVAADPLRELPDRHRGRGPGRQHHAARASDRVAADLDRHDRAEHALSRPGRRERLAGGANRRRRHQRQPADRHRDGRRHAARGRESLPQYDHLPDLRSARSEPVRRRGQQRRGPAGRFVRHRIRTSRPTASSPRSSTRWPTA